MVVEVLKREVEVVVAVGVAALVRVQLVVRAREDVGDEAANELAAAGAAGDRRRRVRDERVVEHQLQAVGVQVPAAARHREEGVVELDPVLEEARRHLGGAQRPRVRPQRLPERAHGVAPPDDRAHLAPPRAPLVLNHECRLELAVARAVDLIAQDSLHHLPADLGLAPHDARARVLCDRGRRVAELPPLAEALLDVARRVVGVVL